MLAVWWERRVNTKLVTKIRIIPFQEKIKASHECIARESAAAKKYDSRECLSNWCLTGGGRMGIVFQAEGTAFAKALRGWGAQPYLERNELVPLKPGEFPPWSWSCKQGLTPRASSATVRMWALPRVQWAHDKQGNGKIRTVLFNLRWGCSLEGSRRRVGVQVGGLNFHGTVSDPLLPHVCSQFPGPNLNYHAWRPWLFLQAQSKLRIWASLVAQCLRICLPMQGTRVRALVWEDPTCRGATRPVSHNYWACASGACAPRQERPR